LKRSKEKEKGEEEKKKEGDKSEKKWGRGRRIKKREFAKFRSAVRRKGRVKERKLTLEQRGWHIFLITLITTTCWRQRRGEGTNQWRKIKKLRKRDHLGVEIGGKGRKGKDGSRRPIYCDSG
jgi:hypothetical protein